MYPCIGHVLSICRQRHSINSLSIKFPIKLSMLENKGCECCLLFQSGEGLNECEQVLSALGSVTAMCIDTINGAIVAGVQEYIRSVPIFYP